MNTIYLAQTTHVIDEKNIGILNNKGNDILIYYLNEGKYFVSVLEYEEQGRNCILYISSDFKPADFIKPPKKESNIFRIEFPAHNKFFMKAKSFEDVKNDLALQGFEILELDKPLRLGEKLCHVEKCNWNEVADYHFIIEVV